MKEGADPLRERKKAVWPKDRAEEAIGKVGIWTVVRGGKEEVRGCNWSLRLLVFFSGPSSHSGANPDWVA